MTQEKPKQEPAHGWISTASGKVFELLRPDPGAVCIDDIAVSLANLPRFSGHFGAYTVAQHSVLVSYHCKKALAGLLHDAHEAYVGDLVAPLKWAMRARGFDFNAQIVAPIDEAIAEAFGIKAADFHGPDVKYADQTLLATEKHFLLPDQPRPWHPLPPPLRRPLAIWTADYARGAFLDRFRELRGRKGAR